MEIRFLVDSIIRRLMNRAREWHDLVVRVQADAFTAELQRWKVKNMSKILSGTGYNVVIP